jgi:PleD family two-component response regulator
MSNEGTDALKTPALQPSKGGVPKGNLLIVDGKPANLRLLSAMLVEQGYKVVLSTKSTVNPT